MGRQGTRAQPPLLTAADDLRLQRDTPLRRHIQRAYALRSTQLVRGERQVVDAVHRQRQLAGGLCGIDVQGDAALTAHGGQRRQVLHDTGLAVDVHQ